MVTNIGGNEIYEKHSVQMKGFLVNVVIDFFSLQINEYLAQFIDYNLGVSHGMRLSAANHKISNPDISV